MSENDINPLPTERSISRRTIVKGAAWSVPAVAVAVAAPAHAASAATCPVVTNPSMWTFSNNGYITSNGYTGTADGRTYIYMGGDNNTANNSVYTGRAYAQTTISVTKGQTLTLTYEAFGNYGDWSQANGSGTYAHFYIAGSQISRDYGTRTNEWGNVQLPIQSGPGAARPWTSYSSSWTADRTGSVTLMWEFVVPPRGGNQTASDDITVTLPNIVCS